MKAYCDNCKDTKPAFFDLCHDAETGEPFEDLVCYDCHSIIACITDRTDTLAAKVRELEEERDIFARTLDKRDGELAAAKVKGSE